MKLNISKFKQDFTNEEKQTNKEAFTKLAAQLEDIITSRDFAIHLQESLEKAFSRSNEVEYEITLDVTPHGDSVEFASKFFINFSTSICLDSAFVDIPTKYYTVPPLGWEEYLRKINDIFVLELLRDNEGIQARASRGPKLMNETTAKEGILYYNIIGKIMLT